ncbi:piggyBac transposable element-derived protein 4 [Trichonephila clavipes]|nr:piggyBac transposable element-derived protein 4 [Trichonephila clavipes]
MGPPFGDPYAAPTHTKRIQIIQNKILRIIANAPCKVGLKVDASNLKSENDFFKLMLTDEILEVLVAETNRYAITVLNLHEETSDKRKHPSSWKPTDKNNNIHKS